MFLAVPCLPAEIPAKIAGRSLLGGEHANLFGGDQEHILTWVVRDFSPLFGKLLLQGLCLVYLDVTLYCKVNEIRVEIAAWSHLQLGWFQVGLDIEVNKAPVFEESMKADDAAHISCQILSTHCC